MPEWNWPEDWPEDFPAQLKWVAQFIAPHSDPVPAPAPPPPSYPGGTKVKQDLKAIIPALGDNETQWDCPADNTIQPPELRCYWRHTSLMALVIHLNDDSHGWTREQIADWLETLDVDLSFQPVEEPGGEVK